MTRRSWIHKLPSSRQSMRRPSGVPAGRVRLAVDLLEDRLVPSTFHVLTNGDLTGPARDGGAPGHYLVDTLRAAIDRANDESHFPGADTIVFDLPAGQEQIRVAQN